MVRRSLLAALTLVAMASSAPAQFGGMGGMGGGMGGMGGGMGGMGGGMGGMAAQNTAERAVVVETDGGQKLSGKMQLHQVAVSTELGQYQINPLHVKAIRFGKRPASNTGEGVPNSPQATVVTTSDREITGMVVSGPWTLDLDFGSLSLELSRVKSITFAPREERGNSPGTAAAPPAQGRLRVTSIEGPSIAALMVEGPRITRIAASNRITGDWIPCDLRTPFEGRAMPIVGQAVAVYALGPNIYAFSAEQKRWDVLELPKGSKSFPIVGPGSVRVQAGNKIHEFAATTGKWKHVDLEAILEEGDSRDSGTAIPKK